MTRSLWWRVGRRAFLAGRYYRKRLRRLLVPPVPLVEPDAVLPTPDVMVDLGAVRFAVHSGTPAVRAELERLFPGAVLAYEPESGTQATFRFEPLPPQEAPQGQAEAVWVSCAVDDAPSESSPVNEIAGRILSVATLAVLGAEQSWPHLHAAAAVIAGRAAVVPGPSGHGKTTLVAHLAAGRELLTDELLAVDRAAGRVRATLRPLSLKAVGEESLAAVLQPGFERPVGAAAWWVPARAIGARHVPEAAPGAILLVERRPGPAVLEPAEPTAALEALIANAYDLTRDPVGSIRGYAWLVTQSHVLTAHYADAGDIVEQVAALLAAGPPDPPAWKPEVRIPPALSGPHARQDRQVITAVLGPRAVLYHRTSRQIVRLDPAGTATWLRLSGGEATPSGTESFVADLRRLGFVEGGTDG